MNTKVILFGFLISTLIVVLYLFLLVRRSLNKTVCRYIPRTLDRGVSLREFPYPFKCAVTLCNDVDEMESLSEFLTIQEFLNTRNQTAMGQGVGLEIGNSFYGKESKFGFVSDNSSDREIIIDLNRLGYIDSIHSFCDATRREEIRHIVDLLVSERISVDVWINHSSVASNLSSEHYPRVITSAKNLGDNPAAAVYHTDFSLKDLGYRFAWFGAVSGILGQGRPVSFKSFFDGFDRRFPLQSLQHNVLKNIVKFTLAVFGNKKYMMMKDNELVRVTHLLDGQAVFEFSRSNQCYYGIYGKCDTANGLGDNLRDDVLERLIRVAGYMIIYTHLGKNDGFPYLPSSAVEALRLLERKNKKGDIWVTTTSRMLRYYVNKKYLKWESRRSGDRMSILIHSIEDPVRGHLVPDAESLGGLTFHVDSPDKTDILIDGRKVSEIILNDADETGRKSVSIPLYPLKKIDLLMTTYRAKGYF